jgi:hypothetical protein
MRKDADDINAYFLVLADGHDAAFALQEWDVAHMIGITKSKGYIESFLPVGYDMCHTTYVLRLDDDESLSDGLKDWLHKREYWASPKWRIATMALYPNKRSFIRNKPLWPDPHLRLTTWRYHPKTTEVHGALEFGPMAPHALLHWKYINKTKSERLKLAEHYDSISEGAGTGEHMPFTLPEDYYPEGVLVSPVEDGSIHDREEVLFRTWGGKLRNPDADTLADFLGSVG